MIVSESEEIPPYTLNTEYRIQNTEYRIQNTEYRIMHIAKLKKTLESGQENQLTLHKSTYVE